MASKSKNTSINDDSLMEFSSSNKTSNETSNEMEFSSNRSEDDPLDFDPTKTRHDSKPLDLN